MTRPSWVNAIEEQRQRETPILQFEDKEHEQRYLTAHRIENPEQAFSEALVEAAERERFFREHPEFKTITNSR